VFAPVAIVGFGSSLWFVAGLMGEDEPQSHAQFTIKCSFSGEAIWKVQPLRSALVGSSV
jgi:hypothetical protein